MPRGTVFSTTVMRQRGICSPREKLGANRSQFGTRLLQIERERLGGDCAGRRPRPRTCGRPHRRRRLRRRPRDAPHHEPSIWAARDITGLPKFTHTAGVNDSVAATNAILGLRRKAETRVIPRVTFTAPEVAAVGVRPDEADAHGHRVVTWDH